MPDFGNFAKKTVEKIENVAQKIEKIIEPDTLEEATKQLVDMIQNTQITNTSFKTTSEAESTISLQTKKTNNNWQQ